MSHPKHVEQLAGNKNVIQKCHLVGTSLKLKHQRHSYFELSNA
jgi:hypothetical protein